MAAAAIWIAVGAALMLAYVLVWQLWARPRLILLRVEASMYGYRVPREIVALYLAGALLAPLTALALAGMAAPRAIAALRGRYQWLTRMRASRTRPRT